MVDIFSRTIITVFVIDSKPVLTFGTVAWKLPKMLFDVTLVTSIWTCRDFVARQLRIPNRYKDLRPNCQIAPPYDPRVRDKIINSLSRGASRLASLGKRWLLAGSFHEIHG